MSGDRRRDPRPAPRGPARGRGVRPGLSAGGAGTAAAPPLAVVLKGYPRLSETFIAQELKALEDRGLDFAIWSLRAPYDDRTHPIHGEIGAPVAYLPEYLYREPFRVLRGVVRAARLPGFGRAFRTWLGDLARDLTANRVRRFGQACVLAAELPGATRFLYAHFLHTPASVARYAAAMRGLGWGFSAHAKDIWTIPVWEKREKIADARFGVTCTAAGAEHLRALAGGRGRIERVYHGLDLGRFPPPPDIRPHGRPFRLLSVGRLVEKKGYGDLLAALAQLPPELDWRLVHIGGGALGAELRMEARRLGLDGRIEWQGKRDQRDVIAEMRRAELFVLPSKIADDGDRDGLPNVLMEAASQRLPILSTEVSAIPEFVEHRRHGYLVPPGSPEALARAIRLLASDPGLREAMAAAAHARLVAEFGMEAGIDTLHGLLAEALAAAGEGPGGGPAADEGGRGREPAERRTGS